MPEIHKAVVNGDYPVNRDAVCQISLSKSPEITNDSSASEQSCADSDDKEQKIMQKLGYSIPEVVRLTSIGRSSIYEALASGRLKARKLGKRTIVLENDIADFLKALPSLTEKRAA